MAATFFRSDWACLASLLVLAAGCPTSSPGGTEASGVSILPAEQEPVRQPTLAPLVRVDVDALDPARKDVRWVEPANSGGPPSARRHLAAVFDLVWTPGHLIGDFDGDGACDYLTTHEGTVTRDALSIGNLSDLLPAALLVGVRGWTASPTDLDSVRYELSYGRRLDALDIDGDGARDLLLAQPGYDAFGDSIYDGVGKLHAWRWTGKAYEPHAVLTGSTSFGGTLSGALDFDGDGLEDVAVSAPELGRVVVVRGGQADSWSTLEAGIASGSVIELETTGLGPLAGWSLVGPGDLDQDGRDELLISTTEALHLVRGGTTQPDLKIAGEAPDPLLAVGGDFDGDGYADLAVGASLAGRITLIHGAKSLARGTLELGAESADRPRLVGIGSLRGLGPSVDHNRDGRADLWVIGFDETWLVYGGLPAGDTSIDAIGSDADMGARGFLVGSTGRETVIGEAIGACDIDGDGAPESLVSVAFDQQSVGYRMESTLVIAGGQP